MCYWRLVYTVCQNDGCTNSTKVTEEFVDKCETAKGSARVLIVFPESSCNIKIVDPRTVKGDQLCSDCRNLTLEEWSHKDKQKGSKDE